VPAADVLHELDVWLSFEYHKIVISYITTMVKLKATRQERMALLKLRRSAQITLPAELRKKFNLSEGDYLEAEAVADGILLKPMAVIEREKAGDALLKVMDRVHAKQRPSKKSPKAQEEEIAGIVKEYRKAHAKRRA
jgi:AbrB family looped-hinge helix DNA binding protein